MKRHDNYVRLEKQHAWKGDNASDGSKRARIRRRLPLTVCEICGAKAVDRHHKDGNTGNNELSNVQQLCRRCHMVVDGRIQIIMRNTAPMRQLQPLKRCSECGRLYKAKWATIPPELANCVADYAERLLELQIEEKTP